MKKTAIQILAEPALYKGISAAAKAARMSRSAWVALAAEEKLARLEQERRSQEMRQPARPAGDDGEDAA